MALFQSGTSHCGNLLNWHLILFRIIKNDFIVVALDQWELRRQGRGGEDTLKDLDHRQNKG